jgi:hypothetical protein
MKTAVFNTDGEFLHFDDPRSLEEAKAESINRIRHFASSSITDCGIDEVAQQNAALGIYSPERCEAIKSYIAACRNEYLRCKALILAATTNDEADAVQFVTPEVPTGL